MNDFYFLKTFPTFSRLSMRITYCYYKYISFNIEENKDGNLRPTLLVTECPPTVSGNEAAEYQSLSCPYLAGKTYLNPKIVQGKEMEKEHIEFLLALIFMFHINTFFLH